MCGTQRPPGFLEEECGGEKALRREAVTVVDMGIERTRSDEGDRARGATIGTDAAGRGDDRQ